MTDEDVSEKDAERHKSLSGRFGSYQGEGGSASESAEPDSSARENTISETQETQETGETQETRETEETEGTPHQKDKWKGDTVRERENLNLYIPEEVVDEIQATYAELNAEYRRKYGEDMEKNSQYYPHLLMSALDDTDGLRDRLGLDDE